MLSSLSKWSVKWSDGVLLRDWLTVQKPTIEGGEVRFFLFLIFISCTSSAFADEIKMKCDTRNIMENETTFFKFNKSFFRTKAFQKKDGNWIDLSSNQRLLDYDVGDLSAKFLVKKRSDWWLRVVLDFETKELHFKNCFTRECEDGKLVGRGSKKCE